MEYLKHSNVPEYSVSEISDAIKNTVEDHFTYLKIRGEVSGLKIHSSGHIYFNLKDENSVLNAVCFRNTASKLKMMPEEGLEIIVTGKITTYKQRSNYQIIISNLETAGAGALMALYEKRKKEFEKLGYFDVKHKLPIPKIPKSIAIITSETGAVFHDICHRIKERFPCHLMLLPALVQGKGAEIQIANAIHQINELRDNIPDVIIIARGGGSIEDLWCFNEEIIIKSVFESKIPIISAIGHETDTTLIDYVSDLRAPTPTAAAELATPVKAELELKIMEFSQRNLSKLTKYVSSKEENINYLSLTLKSPDNILNYFYQRLDDLDELLAQKTSAFNVNLENKIKYLGLKLVHPKTYLDNKFLVFNQMIIRLDEVCNYNLDYFAQKLANFKINKYSINSKISEFSLKTKGETHKLTAFVNNYIAHSSTNLNNLNKILESLSYKNVLERGYVVIRDDNNQVITESSQIKENQLLEAEFRDGRIKLQK